MSYTPDCADCPTPAECKEKNDCQVMRQIRHGPRSCAPAARHDKQHLFQVGDGADCRECGKPIADQAAHIAIPASTDKLEALPLERLKTEAERWIAAVGGAMPITADAAKGLRDIVQRAHDLGCARSAGGDSDLKIKAEAMNMVLAVVSAKANVDTNTLMSMLKEAEEELRAKRWLS